MVYLLCFDRKLKHAKHYIGYANSKASFEKRLACHQKGKGSKLMAAVSNAGIGFCVARTWPDGDRNFERKLKNRKKASQLCPHCSAAKKAAKKIAKEWGKDVFEPQSNKKVAPNVQTVLNNFVTPEISKDMSEAVRDQLVCPVVEVFKSPSHYEDVKRREIAQKTMEVSNVEPANQNFRGRWTRVWRGMARLWFLFKDKFVSKR